jgi:hypothetical protein
MKKNVISLLIIFCCLCFSACTGDADVHAIDSDCEYLKTIIEEASIDISKTIDEGLDSAKLIEDIKAEYVSLFKKKYPEPKLNENGIDANRFAQAINTVLFDNLTRANCHISIYGEGFGYAPFIPYVTYFSDVFFEKSGESYIVYSSKNKRIKPGMKYTGDEMDLYKTFVDGRELYRFGIFANQYPARRYISIEGKDYRVPVSIATDPIDQEENLSYKLEDKVLKIVFSSCTWKTEAEYNRLMDAMDSICKIIKEQPVELVLVDLRRNGGGSVSISQFLTGALCGILGGQEEDDFWNYMSYLNYGAVYINTLTTRTVNALKGRGGNDGNQYLLGKSNEKYVLLNEEYEENFIRQITPEYKGKILLVTDWGTASAAEDFIGFLKVIFKDNVIVVGQNTLGCLDYGNIHDFLLRNSRLKITLCQTDSTNIVMFNSNIGWHGDGRGFYPDFWYRLDDDLDVQELISLIR